MQYFTEMPEKNLSINSFRSHFESVFTIIIFRLSVAVVAIDILNMIFSTILSNKDFLVHLKVIITKICTISAIDLYYAINYPLMVSYSLSKSMFTPLIKILEMQIQKFLIKFYSILFSLPLCCFWYLWALLLMNVVILVYM